MYPLTRITSVCILLICCLGIMRAQTREKVMIRSTLDHTDQPCYLMLPEGFDNSKPTPLVVLLHTWSGGIEQRQPKFEEEAMRRGWVLVFPHFRGPNQHPNACGSKLAQQDILDAVQWAKKKYKIDDQRVYITGVSGGGHMTMLMAARHPKAFTAASAWVGISDLAAWHKKHAKARYGAMIRKSCGGAPGESKAVDAEYRARSPIHFLQNATSIPLDIAAGIHDGHTGSVPVRHSLDAFNRIAIAVKARPVSKEEIGLLSQRNGRLSKPEPSDRERDLVLGREIHLRRYAGKSRVTIFEGGHEGIAAAAFDWLANHPRREVQ